MKQGFYLISNFFETDFHATAIDSKIVLSYSRYEIFFSEFLEVITKLTGKLMWVVEPQYLSAAKSYALAAFSSLS